MSEVAARLSFNESGRFRICQFTDLHLITTERPTEFRQTLDLISKTVRDTTPDLIAITGDLTWGETVDDVDAIDALVETLSEFDTPWAPVLGNHDGDKIGRGFFADLLLNRKNCLFNLGRDDVDGHGNYIVSVDDEWYLYFMDSHRGEFFQSQINWYRETSKAFSKDHNELCFFHVPIPEYIEVWDYEPCKGFNMEAVCATSLNDGLFSAMVRSGAMRGIFVGHDHINDFEGTLHNIRLCYGRGSGYQCYGLEGFRHGARIIDIKKGSKDFATQIYLETGDMYEQKHRSVPAFRRKR